MMVTKLIAGLLMSLAVGAAVASQSGRALAQYPPPQGSCVVTTSASVVNPHDAVDVGVTVFDVNGNPVPGVVTQTSVSRQPGSDAVLQGGAATTNASGMASATLDAGSTGGSIGLSARTDAVSCAATVIVGEGAVLGAVRLPDTGSGSRGHGDSLAAFGAFLLGVAGVAAVGAAASRRATGR